MPDSFIQFRRAINKHFKTMQSKRLFRLDIDKHTIWDTYLNSFSSENNPIYLERTEHDCNCCKQWLRDIGSICYVDNSLNTITLWDIPTKNIPEKYINTVKALKQLAHSSNIKNEYIHHTNNVGTSYNFSDKTSTAIKFNHFHTILPSSIVKNAAIIPSYLSKTKSTYEVFRRGLEELTVEALKTVLELIENKSLYRGEENKFKINGFLQLKTRFDNLSNIHQRDNLCWVEQDYAVKTLRNSAIGTLLIDLSNDVDLEQAVKKYETVIMAPSNYKRSNSLVTQAMKDKAEKRIKELGLLESLPRRFAVIEDITVNNVLFANRKATQSMGSVFDLIKPTQQLNKKTSTDAINITWDKFEKTVLPKASDIQVLFENKHSPNLVTLIAPINKDSGHLFKWNNNFSWSYNGEVTDSMQQQVLDKGGNIEGCLRFTIQWNTENDNPNDYDAHCEEPTGNLISYPVKGVRQNSSGMLDVDITRPGNRPAVENIIYTNINKMPDGNYTFKVHNFAHRGGRSGFNAQIEFNNHIYEFQYQKNLKQKENITVGVVNKKGKNFTLKQSLPHSESKQQINNISTQEYHTVSTIMYSPNYWDNNSHGNKHIFFMIEGCKFPGQQRGFYNEFLRSELHEDRKVFEVLASKLKTPKSNKQLSGLGFSTTQQNSVVCKVTTNSTKLYKINF